METRLLIAYFLIGVMLVAALLFVRHMALKRREHRRIMRGYSPLRRGAWRQSGKSVTQP